MVINSFIYCFIILIINLVIYLFIVSFSLLLTYSLLVIYWSSWLINLVGYLSETRTLFVKISGYLIWSSVTVPKPFREPFPGTIPGPSEILSNLFRELEAKCY